MKESVPKSETFSETQKEAVMQYLRDSSHEAIGADLRIANEEEVATAERINALDLAQSDGSTDASYSFPDSNYTPDAVKRGKAFQEAGLDQDSGFDIRKRDIVLNRGAGQTSLKWIGFTQYDENLRRGVDVPGGTIFFGKTVFRKRNGEDDPSDPRDTVFKNLSPEELAEVQQYLDEKYSSEK
jgi:hypothetical protein